MTLTEEGRHRLHTSLTLAIGADAANTLMETLPPVGWADVATNRDLDQLRAEIRAEFTEVRSEMSELRADLRVGQAELRSELHSTLRTNNLTMITANAVLVSVAVALTRLLG
ncbi:MAG: hypothetical protein FJW94_14745 [Actinobacteria bacterium]|nr:hypothetical protein [Actinomycetota bacterium]